MKFLSKFTSLTIKAKLIIMCSLLQFALIGSSGYAIMSMGMIGDEITAIAEEDIPLTNIISEITINQLEQAIAFERSLRFGEEMQNDSSAAKHFKASLQSFESYSKLVNEELKEGEKIAGEAIKLAHSDAARVEFTHIKEVLETVEKEHKSYEQHAEHLFVLLTQGKIHEAHKLAEGIEAEEEKIDHELEALLKEIESFTASATKQAEEHEAHAINVLIIIMILAFVTSAMISTFIIRAISKGLNNAVIVANTIASGDLSKEVATYGNDEIGQLLAALSTMRNNLLDLITGMNSASTDVATSAEELSAVTEQMSQNIHQQQSDVHQSATAINEMTATVQEVARNAGATAESAINANNEANDGKQVVNNTIDSIRQLAESVESAAKVIDQVDEDSNNIGGVLDVIKGIAEQTNLLALNAAIEAARAGEQGRGFAVVADEVRTLAQRTQESTQEIESMIDHLQGSARSAVNVMESGRSQAQVSVEEAGKAGDSLERITSSIATINDMNTQIASAAEEQTAVSEEINRNINSISQASEQSTTAISQATSASEELARMAASLQEMIGRFKIS